MSDPFGKHVYQEWVAEARNPGLPSQGTLGGGAIATDAFVFLQPTFDRRLRPNSRVIHSRQPKDLEALHARAARENVLDAVIQDVAEGERAGDVRRRHHDGERLLLRIRVRFEVVVVDPTLIPFRLNRPRIVSFGELGHFRIQSSRSRACLQNEKLTLTFAAA